MLHYLHKDRKQVARAGFTLPELLTVIGVIGILATISIPGILRWLPNIRLKAAARELYANMQQAKAQAVKTNRNWAVIFDTHDNKYYICADSGADNTWSTLADNTVTKTVDLTSYKSGVAYGYGSSSPPPTSPVTYNHDVLVFNPVGTGNAGYVYIDNEKDTDTLRVGSLTSGSVRIARWNGSYWK